MVDPTQESRALAEAQRTARRIISEDMLWRVYELPPLPFDRRNSSSLVFESDNAVRRVRNYPLDWRHLSDEELLALSWQS
jgi:hypothetical protein